MWETAGSWPLSRAGEPVRRAECRLPRAGFKPPAAQFFGETCPLPKPRSLHLSYDDNIQKADLG